MIINHWNTEMNFPYFQFKNELGKWKNEVGWQDCRINNFSIIRFPTDSMFVTHTTSILFCESNYGSSLKVSTLSISLLDSKTRELLLKPPVALNVLNLQNEKRRINLWHSSFLFFGRQLIAFLCYRYTHLWFIKAAHER